MRIIPGTTVLKANGCEDHYSTTGLVPGTSGTCFKPVHVWYRTEHKTSQTLRISDPQATSHITWHRFMSYPWILLPLWRVMPSSLVPHGGKTTFHEFGVSPYHNWPIWVRPIPLGAPLAPQPGSSHHLREIRSTSRDPASDGFNRLHLEYWRITEWSSLFDRCSRPNIKCMVVFLCIFHEHEPADWIQQLTFPKNQEPQSCIPPINGYSIYCNRDNDDEAVDLGVPCFQTTYVPNLHYHWMISSCCKH